MKTIIYREYDNDDKRLAKITEVKTVLKGKEEKIWNIIEKYNPSFSSCGCCSEYDIDVQKQLKLTKEVVSKLKKMGGIQ